MILKKPIREAHDNELDETWLVGLKRPYAHPPTRRRMKCSRKGMYSHEHYKKRTK